MNFLASYLLHPFQTLRFFAGRRPFWYSMAVMGLASITASVQALPGGWIEAIAVALFFCLLSLLFLTVAAMLWDFSAQLFSLQAQSLKLLSWLGLSLWPLLFLVPLEALCFTLPVPNALYQFVNIVITLAVVFLQVNTLRFLYQTSIQKSILIYFIPVLIAFMAAIGVTAGFVAMGFASL